MNKIRHLMRHPAGLVGLIVGLIIGLLAALMGETKKALVFASLCQFLASRMKR